MKKERVVEEASMAWEAFLHGLAPRFRIATGYTAAFIACIFLAILGAELQIPLLVQLVGDSPAEWTAESHADYDATLGPVLAPIFGWAIPFIFLFLMWLTNRWLQRRTGG